MARAKTSITDTKARKLAETVGEFLFCERIAGLHLKSLKKPGAAAWRYRYKDAEGNRRVYTLGKFPAMSPPKAAELALSYADTDPFAQRAERKQKQQRAAANTVAAYLTGPYKVHQSYKASGAATLRLIEQSFPVLLDRSMVSLVPADISAWQMRQVDAGLAHSTIKRKLGALQTMLNHAKEEGAIDANPVAGVKLPRLSLDEEERAAKREAERRLLTEAEKDGLFAGLRAFADQKRQERRNSRAHGKPELPDLDGVACAHWVIPFTYIARYTGLRPGDILNMTWEQLSVPFGRLRKTPNKTKHNPNPVRINTALAPALLPIMREWWKLAGKPNTGLVFPRRDGEQRDRQAYRKAWARVKELGGLPDDLAFYSLRHNFISEQVNAGLPPMAVAHMVGQKDASMIAMHYYHPDRNRADAALAEQYPAEK